MLREDGRAMPSGTTYHPKLEAMPSIHTATNALLTALVGADRHIHEDTSLSSRSFEGLVDHTIKVRNAIVAFA